MTRALPVTHGVPMAELAIQALVVNIRMHSQLFQWRSLKTRVTLFTLSVFLLSIWSLALYASRMFQEHIQRQLGEQQFSTVSILAANVNEALAARFIGLEKAAETIPREALDNPAAMQAFLEDRPVLSSLFNGGVVVLRQDGTAIAEAPLSQGRVGINYMELDTIAAALKEGSATVGRPVMGEQQSAPVFSMSVPIRDRQGQIVGALSGEVDLGQPNFLDQITNRHFGETGGYLLLATPHRLIVTATDKRRVMQPLPPVGAYPVADRLLHQQNGAAIYVNPHGVEVMSSAKRIPLAGWDMGVSLPTAEAFAPLYHLQWRLLLATLLTTVLAGALGWWMLRRQLAPMLATVNTLAELSHSSQTPQRIPDVGQQEVDQLIGGFNGLLNTLAQREALLKQILDTSSVAIFVVDRQGRIAQANQRMAEMFLCPIEQLVGHEYINLVHPLERDVGREKMLALLHSAVSVVDLDRLYWRSDATEFWGRLTGKRFIDANGQEQGLVGVIADITDRKRTQDFERFRSRILELLASGEPLPSLLEALVLGVEQLNTASLCSCVLLEPDGKHLGRGIAPSLPEFYLENLAGVAIGPMAGSCGTAIFTGERVVVQDIATHPYWAPYRALAAQADLASCWSQPISTATGQMLGAFAIYHRSVRTPAPIDIAIIEQSARLASIAIEKSVDAQKLRDSEVHFRLLTEGVSDVVWRQDRNNHFTYISPADERLRGYPASEVIGRHISELLTEDGILAFQQAVQDQAMATTPGTDADTRTVVLQQRCKHGGTIWVEVRTTAERDASGAITGFHGISREITERKQAESKLQLAASVFTHAQEGIMITMPDGAIIEVNAAFSHITGYSHDEVLGRNPRMLSSGRQNTHFYEVLFAELARNGQWHGELWNRRKNGEIYAQMQTISAVRDAQGRIQHYVALFSDITAMKAHQKQLEHIAHYDALTNLPNRVLLADRLQHGMAQAARRAQPLAVAFLDLDGFKSVNDTHGHDIGDQLLIALATRMKQALRDGDTLARMGGDEFVAVLMDLDDVAASVPLLTRLLDAAAQPVSLGALTLQVSASLGVTFYPQPQEVDADQLLRQADQAMYQAKLAGKNRYQVFDAAYDRSVRGHNESLEHIRQALTDNAFVLYYQPKVNMRTGKLVGAEALVRWQHPVRGLLPPAAFLPVIEEHPLAIDLGEWVINTALTQIQIWQSAGLDIPVSVNIGARQLQQPNFVERLRTILQAHPQVHPTSLELEVLETSALEDLANVSQIMEACLGIGVHFALDDFGTGYSSLTYLKRLPVALLKIDQSFVRDMLDDPDDLAILEGVVGLATAFRRNVIAEGVETVAHGALLLQLGCDLAQGYGIARPMPAQDLPGWAQTWQPDPSWAHLPAVRREDFPMLFAGVEHRAWSRGMENFLQGQREAPPELDQHQCHFGHWLAKEGLARHGAHPAFAAITALHRQAHLLAIALCEMYAEGHGEQARARVGELHAIRDALLEQLRILLAAGA